MYGIVDLVSFSQDLKVSIIVPVSRNAGNANSWVCEVIPLPLEERGSLGRFFSSIILSSWFCLLDNNLLEWKWNNLMLLPNFHGDKMFLSICHLNFILNPGVYSWQALSKLISHTTGDCHYSWFGSFRFSRAVHQCSYWAVLCAY